MLSAVFAALFAGSPDAIMIADEARYYVEANPAALALLGYTREGLLGLRVGDVVAPGPSWAAEEYARFLREGVWNGEVELRRQDGRLVPAEVRAIVVPGPDGPLYASFLRDITERRLGDVDRRMAEARYRTLVEQLPAIVSLDAVDETQSTLYISPMCEAILGYSPDEYLADPTLWVQTVHPDDRERVLADVVRMNVTGEALQDEYRMLARDGRVVWVLEDSTLIRDDAGRPRYWQTVQVDITARKQAEEALRESEERFRSAFDDAAIGMSLAGLDGRYLQVNAALCALTGYTADELLTRTFQEITHPDDLAEDLAQRDRILAGEIRAYAMEKRYLRKDGEEIWIRVNTSLVRDEQGEPLHFIGQVEDITARKAAEAALREAETKYRTLVEQLPAVVYLVANDGRYTLLFYNSYIETITGETPDELMVDPGDWLDAVHPEDREPVAAADARAASTGTVFQVEYRRRRRDGRYVWVRNEAAPIRDDAGQVVAWQGVMFDITERKQAEEDLQAALEAAEAANRAKGVFLNLMSHELRTPLQAVLGYAEALLMAPQEALTAEQREDIGYIHQGGGRMLTLINQVLDLSRMEAGGIELLIKPFDLGEVLEAVRQDVAPQAAAKALEVEIRVAPSLPQITGDAERVRQILLNLAGNAVKFTPQGGVWITAMPEGSGGVKVAVRDTGPGIPEAAQPHIFEAFHQVESGLTRRHQGSGLGLAIAWKLARQMGGSITVSSEPGVGSTFTLHLPEVADHV